MRKKCSWTLGISLTYLSMHYFLVTFCCYYKIPVLKSTLGGKVLFHFRRAHWTKKRWQEHESDGVWWKNIRKLAA